MKKFTNLFIAIALLTAGCQARDVTGLWYGVLKAPQGIELPMIFEIKKDGEHYSATMSVPQQSIKNAPIKTTTFANDTLTFEIPQLAFVYKGTIDNDGLISGSATQHGMVMPLDLSREKMFEEAKRPQEPKQPYPYHSEDVKFRNEEAGINLAGTITIPEGGKQYPAVVLVSGSGLQNRNEEVFDHKPFLVLADYLTRNGIAVLRYDDRGFAESEGNSTNATTADFATDAMAGVQYLKGRKEVNPEQIGIVGHSEGGTIAFMLAAKEKDVAFIVPMAGSTIKGDSILILQNEAIGKGYGMTEDALAFARKINRSVYDIVQSTENKDVRAEKLTEILGTSEKVKGEIKQLASDWIHFFLSYDPSKDIQQIQIPVFALFGGKDVQVLAEPNAESFKQNIPKTNKHAEVKIYPSMNHLFQNAVTGLSNEYQQIDETINPEVLQDIVSWIKNL